MQARSHCRILAPTEHIATASCLVPGFFDSDLTAAKSFHVTEGSSVQFRVAAFNVLNHANSTFTSVNQANYTLTYNPTSSATNVNQALSSIKRFVEPAVRVCSAA